MNIQAYMKGCKRGKFTWECIESGTYGDGNAVDVEETNLEGRNAVIRRVANDCYEAEVDLKNTPLYDEKEFTSRKSARNWCERLIKKDIQNA